MADTFTQALKARKIEQGAYANSYATRFNEDMVDVFDAAISGVLEIDIGSATTYALEAMQNGVLSETHYWHIRFVGTPASAVTVTVPASVTPSKHYLIENATGQILTIKYAATAGITIADGDRQLVYADGTDVGQFATGHKPITNWLSAFRASSTGKLKVSVPGGSYSIASEIVHTGDVDIECLGPVTITCTAGATINSIFKVTGKLRIFGAPMIIDGDDNTYLLIHCPTVLPELENITFRNCLSVAGLFGRDFGGANANDYSGANGVGHGWMRNCRGENCGTFTFPTGSGKTSDTSFQLIDCSTDANCGDISNVFALNSLGYGLVRGGWYKGASTTAPNMTQTGRCEYVGGRYENMTRGPTIGEDSDYVTIVGGVSVGMSFSGVSLDARLGSDNSVPYVTGKVDWTVEGAPTHGVFCQASGVEINVRYIGDGTATSSNNVVRLTDALDVSIGRVSADDAGGSILVHLGAGSAPSPGSSAYKTGDWQSDTTSVTPIRCTTSASTIRMSKTRTLTADGDISFLDETIFVDTASGAVDVDLPPVSVSENVIGKQWRIKVINSTNNVTITRDGGGATAINGGASYTITAGAANREVIVESIGGGNYTVTVSV